MKKQSMNLKTAALLSAACMLAASNGLAAPKTISLYAKVVWINPVTGNAGNTQASPSLGRIPMWGFSTSPSGPARVPGPQIDVDPSQYAEGLVITVYNQLSEPISVVIPGLNGSADSGQPVKFGFGDPNYPNRVRSLVPEVAPGGSRAYTWTGPLKVGTYVYHSGSHAALQVQMGLFGMVTVKSSTTQPYPGVTVAANREVPVIFSELDPNLHWAVHTNDYGPGKGISSTIHSEPSYYLINGRAYSKITAPPNLVNNGNRNQATLFRMINVCWDSRIPVLAGPVPAGNFVFPGSGGNYLTLIAEDGNLYPFPKTSYAPLLPALKTLDILFTPPDPGGPQAPLTYMLYDHRLGLSNNSQPDGGMYAKWIVR